MAWHSIFTGRDALKNAGTAQSDESKDEAEDSTPRSSPSSLLSSVQKNPWPHIVSPVYVSVLVLGIVSLIVIGIVAATVIRKNKRLYAEQYGALEFQHRGKVTHCECDSDPDSIGSSQPYLHFVCSNSREAWKTNVTILHVQNYEFFSSWYQKIWVKGESGDSSQSVNRLSIELLRCLEIKT